MPRSRSRSRSPVSKRERRRSRSRERRHRKKRSRSPRHRPERVSPPRRPRSKSNSPRKRSESPRTHSLSKEREIISPEKTTDPKEIDESKLTGLDEEQQNMMKLMGFANFDTTKGKKVAGNEIYSVNLQRKRRYRQYMNRKGGFNRPLDFIA